MKEHRETTVINNNSIRMAKLQEQCSNKQLVCELIYIREVKKK